MERPRLKAHFISEVVDGSKVFLLAEGKDFLVQGAAAAAVLPHLDGRKTVAEIVVALSGQLAITETLTALRRYEAAGHLAEGRPEMSDEALAFGTPRVSTPTRWSPPPRPPS